MGEETANFWSFPALSFHPSPAWCLFNILLFVKEFNHKTLLYLHDDELYRWCLSFFLFSSPPSCLAACCCLCRNPPCRWHFIGQCHHALCILISHKWLRSWPRAKNDLATLPKILFWYFFFPWCFACSCRNAFRIKDELHSHMTSLHSSFSFYLAL